MLQDFVLFGETRTGSYSLMSRLASCSDIVCHGEIFKRNRIEISRFHMQALSSPTVEARNHDPLGFIRALRAVNPHRIFGFKFFHHHLAWAPSVVEHLKAPSTRRVILHRDPLEMYASTLRAHATGIWTLREGDGRKPPQDVLDRPVVHTREALDAFAGKYNGFIVIAHLLAALPGSHVIPYEQINDEEAIGSLLRFLGSKANPAESQTEYRKQYGGGLEEAFANWDELQADLERRHTFATPPSPSWTKGPNSAVRS